MYSCPPTLRLNQLTGQQANQPTNQPTSQPANQSTSQPAHQTTNQTANQATNQLANQPINELASQPISLKRHYFLVVYKDIWHQNKKKTSSGVQQTVCFCLFFAFINGWFGISPAGALGSLEALKPYGGCDLTTKKRPNLTHTMIWRPKGVQTLRRL